MQHQSRGRPGEQSTQEKLVRAAWLAGDRFYSHSALEFSKQIERSRNAAEGASVAKNSRIQKSSALIVLQFGDAIFHVRSMVVVSQSFWRGARDC